MLQGNRRSRVFDIIHIEKKEKKKQWLRIIIMIFISLLLHIFTTSSIEEYFTDIIMKFIATGLLSFLSSSLIQFYKTAQWYKHWFWIYLVFNLYSLLNII